MGNSCYCPGDHDLPVAASSRRSALWPGAGSYGVGGVRYAHVTSSSVLLIIPGVLVFRRDLEQISHCFQRTEILSRWSPPRIPGSPGIPSHSGIITGATGAAWRACVAPWHPEWRRRVRTGHFHLPIRQCRASMSLGRRRDARGRHSPSARYPAAAGAGLQMASPRQVARPG